MLYFVVVGVFLSIASAVSPLTRRHSKCINCELLEHVVGRSELKFFKKQKSQSCFCAPHVLKVQKGSHT